MSTTHATLTAPVGIAANCTVTKCLGNWSTARELPGAVHRRPRRAEPALPAHPGRRIVLTGQVRHGGIRVHRGRIAQLSAMFSREYQADLRRAHREGGFPTVDDPARTA